MKVSLFQDKFGEFSITLDDDTGGVRIAGPNITLAKHLRSWPLSDFSLKAISQAADEELKRREAAA